MQKGAKSQRERVLSALRKRTKVGLNSFWGYKNFVPRLAAIIFNLKRDGYSITSKDNRNGSCTYFLKED